MNKKAQVFSRFFTGELIDEILEGALALVFIGLGLNYFAIQQNWVNAIGLFSAKTGISIKSEEINMITTAISNNFPFSLFNAKTVTAALIIGIIIFIFGFVLKVILVKSKAELIKDIGKIIAVPAIIGIVSLVFIYIMSASSIQNVLFRQNTLFGDQLTSASAGTYIWNTMGVMLLIGIFGILGGMLITTVIRALGSRPVIALISGKFLTLVGFVSLAYYILIRIMAIPVISDTLLGEYLLKIFIFVWYMGKNGFILSLCLFGFGLEMYKYGKFLEMTERRVRIREMQNMQVEQMSHIPHYYSQNYQTQQQKQQNTTQPYSPKNQQKIIKKRTHRRGGIF